MNIMNYATQQVVTVNPGDSIDEAIVLMEEHGFHHLVVRSEGQVCGMLSDRDVLISTGWMLAVERGLPQGQQRSPVGPAKVEQIMSRPVVCLSNRHTAREAAIRFVQDKHGALPVEQDGHLVGIVTETDLLKALADAATPGNPAGEFLAMNVGALMRQEVVTATPQTTIVDIIRSFQQHHIRHVPVTVDQRLVGLISDRDVRRALGWVHVRDIRAAEKGESFAGLHLAREIMQAHPHTIVPDASLYQALNFMLSHQIRALPVVQGERLVGIVTESDYVRAIADRELL